jgi:hypothetical protein
MTQTVTTICSVCRRVPSTHVVQEGKKSMRVCAVCLNDLLPHILSVSPRGELNVERVGMTVE